jgi:ABC-type transport system substrate-binding protein
MLSMALAVVACPGGVPAAEPAAPKVLRYAFPVAETSFDPAQISDLYSRTVTAAIFETPLTFDFLARPFKMKPSTAEALPEISSDFKRFTFKIRRGIYFAPDPAFNGQPRELTAHDYVYSIKRHYDPRWKSPNLYLLENTQVLGLSELRKKALDGQRPFDYDSEAEGVRALDRYTLQITLGEPAPRFHQRLMTDAAAFGAVAREVVEAYGDKVTDHPVGTGPFMLAEWRRSSRIVLVKNPNFRERFYDEEATPGDSLSEAIAQRMKGRRIPMIDRVEIAIIEESQPRWLSFLSREADIMERLPNEFATGVVPNGKLSPALARKGIQMLRTPLVDSTFAAFFNQQDPVVGGYSADKVALRRAISLAYNAPEEIALVRKHQAVPAQGIIAPGTTGYNPAFKSEMSDFDPARARALLDMFGYVDRDGDGWRDLPDGRPLTLELAIQPDQLSRQLAELWQKSMRTVNIRMQFKPAKWPENLKASRAGKLMMWGVAWSAESPDGDTFLSLAYGPNIGGSNHARFDLPAYNALYQQQARLPDGPQRERVMEDSNKLLIAYLPYKVSSHRIATDLMHPWLFGFRRNPFVLFWPFVDIDTALREQALKP